jgi:hypothetical protein
MLVLFIIVRLALSDVFEMVLFAFWQCTCVFEHKANKL